MDFFWLFIINLIFFLWLIKFIYRKRFYEYWSKRGIDGPEPVFPFGNILHRLTKSTICFEQEWMNCYGKIYGIYYGWKPALTIIDTKLIKQVMIKDFQVFNNRRKSNVYHEIWSQNLFISEDEQWKRARTIMSPSFTSGKLRSMYYFMNKCIDRLDDYLNACQREQSSKDIDMKKACVGLTIDVIASTVFATETNANGEFQKDHPFVTHGVNLFNFPFYRVVGFWMFPKFINDLLKINYLFKPEHLEFFLSLAKSIFRNRKMESEKSSIKRNDMVQLLIDCYTYEDQVKSNDDLEHLIATDDDDHQQPPVEAQSTVGNRQKHKLNEAEIIAQCGLFFVAGFETTATTLTFAFYELAMNPSIQQRLYEELLEFHTKHQSKELEEYCEKFMTELPYLEAVVKETLRKYPPVVRLERRVGVEGYKLDGIPLDKGTIVEIPTLAVHYCPDYYPNPQKFDPERFLPEYKHLLDPYAYLPFGLGPRNCIGMRFAYQELKFVLCRIVLRYNFKPNDRTPKTIQFPKAKTLNGVRQLPIRVEKRNQQ